MSKILVIDIEGTEGRYFLYSDGRVFSRKSGRFMTPYPNTDGYLGYKLRLVHPDGVVKWKKCSVHRLLAKAFLPNPLNLETVNHKDKNKLNNSLDNLEWTTREGNVKHGLQRCYKAVSPNGIVFEFKGQAEFCRLHGLTQANFSKMLMGERPSCQGWTRYEQ